MAVCAGMRTIVGSTNCGPRSVRRPPPATMSPPSALICVDGGKHVRQRVGRDERSHQRGRIERVANAHLLVRAHQPIDQLARDRLLHDDAPRRGAALAGGADRAEQDRARREIEVGVLGDDDRVVAAELEDRPAEAFGHRRRNVLADLRRARERDERQPAIAEHALADGAPGTDRQREDAAHAVVGHDAVGDVLHGDRAERRRRGRLPHHGVAADRGNRRVPRPDGDRKVEGGDHADHARADATAPSSGAPAAPSPSSGRRADARGRSRSRRCRSSPALRRGPRRGSFPSRATRDRRAAPSARGGRSPGRARALRASARASSATIRTRATASPTTWSYDSADACSTRAIGSPVVGLYDTSSCAPGALIQRSAPADAPWFTSSSFSFASKAGVVTMVGIRPLPCRALERRHNTQIYQTRCVACGFARFHPGSPTFVIHLVLSHTSLFGASTCASFSHSSTHRLSILTTEQTGRPSGAAQNVPDRQPEVSRSNRLRRPCPSARAADLRHPTSRHGRRKPNVRGCAMASCSAERADGRIYPRLQRARSSHRQAQALTEVDEPRQMHASRGKTRRDAVAVSNSSHEAHAGRAVDDIAGGKCGTDPADEHD